MSYGYQPYGYQTAYGNPNYMQRGYAPQTPQIPQAQQQAPQMAMAQPMPPMEMPIQDIKYVNKAQADAYIVFPNTKVMLIDREGDMVYIKTADAMGQSQTEYFRFEPVNADGSPIKPQEPVPQIDFDQFVRMEQIKDLGFVTIDEHKKVLSELEAIKKAIAPKPQVQKGGNQ